MHESDSENLGYDDLWILKFNKQKEHMFLERIPDHFLEDKFNFYLLKDQVEDFRDAYCAILDEGPSINFVSECKLYYYLHQRYIVYNKSGTNNIIENVRSKMYGSCSKYGCKESPFIPVGLSNEFGRGKTKLYCNSCKSLYEPKGALKKLDGCVWGTVLCPYLILMNVYCFTQNNKKEYTPKLFGFEIEVDENSNLEDSE